MVSITLFPDEFNLEELEQHPQGSNAVLYQKIQKMGQEKTEEPLHRAKTLRGWPTEHNKKALFQEIYNQETGKIGGRDDIEEWKETRACELWETITVNLSESEKKRILKEYSISHISQTICNTIRLEEIYRNLKPLGESLWKITPPKIKPLLERESLRDLTEDQNLFLINGKEKEILDWVKGAILYLALQNKPNLASTPDPAYVRSAALWCLNPHLHLLGKKTTLEETNEIFNGWNLHRQKIRLLIETLPIQLIPEETKVTPPLLHEKELPWILAWRILPILEKEIRTIGEKILHDTPRIHALGTVYKKRLFDRWIVNSIRRAYLRKFEDSQTTAEKWRNKTLIFTPINNFITFKIPGESPHLRLIAKTEAVWMLLSEKLPEQEE